MSNSRAIRQARKAKTTQRGCFPLIDVDQEVDILTRELERMKDEVLVLPDAENLTIDVLDTEMLEDSICKQLEGIKEKTPDREQYGQGSEEDQFENRRESQTSKLTLA